MTQPIPIPCVPVSWGELIDKITILEIKLARLRATDALANARTEHDALAAALTPLGAFPAELERLRADLVTVNTRLWDIEDAIREHEARSDFGAGFIALARSVYRENDMRGQLKREISTLLGSAIVEEKQYAAY
jgi:hypothetical protein